jgi:hypothetical protein
VQDDPVIAPSWLIGLDSWVIHDCNYPDFVAGQRTDFAVDVAVLAVATLVVQVWRSNSGGPSCETRPHPQ